jgi:multicomponent Na+:H+ antiporter subunit E
LSTSLDGARQQLGRAAIARAALFLCFWLMISGGNGLLLAVGLVAVAIATGTSVRLLPQGLRMRPLGAMRLAGRVMGQSVVAGIDVSRRAFDPFLSLRSGFIAVPLCLPVGFARSAFCTISSVQPGALPAGSDSDDALVVHCIDVEQPPDMAVEEASFVQALRHD